MPKTMSTTGFISLTAVIVISAVMVAIALTLGLSSISQSQYSLFTRYSATSFQAAQACSEEAYYRLKLDNNYAGGIVDFGANSCSISVNGSGGSRTITASTTVNDFTRTIISSVDLIENIATTANTIDLTQWE